MTKLIDTRHDHLSLERENGREGFAVLQMDCRKQILCILYDCYVESET